MIFVRGRGRFQHRINEQTSAYIGLYRPAPPKNFISQIDVIPSIDMIYMCCFIADLRSAITVCLPRSLTIRCQQPIFALFTYLSCRQLPSNAKVLQLHDNFIIVLYYILLSCLILTE